LELDEEVITETKNNIKIMATKKLLELGATAESISVQLDELEDTYNNNCCWITVSAIGNPVTTYIQPSDEHNNNNVLKN